MNGHASYHRPDEESLALLDEKTLSDLEADADHAETERLFPSRTAAKFLRPAVRAMRPSHLRTTALRTAWALLPSFVQARLSKERPKPARLAPTAYLDGMRGLAALFVFFCHYSYTCFVITQGYGFGPENNHILQLPFIRLLYSGPPMVCIFFVISGYALSLKPLKQMRSRSYDGLLQTLSSSVFRRGLRLFLPTFASTFLVFCLIRLGMYEPSRPITQNKLLHRNVQEYHHVMLPTFRLQFAEWLEHMWNFVCVFDWSNYAGSTGYDLHLWTIPVEFRASTMLFLAIIGLARLRPKMRITLIAGLFMFVLRKDRWELMLFLAGMLIAECDLILTATSTTPLSPLSPLSTSHPSPPRQRRARTAFWALASICGLYLMSQPDEGFDRTPGWVFLSSKIPVWFSQKYRFWQCWGAIVCVWSVMRSPPLQRLFTGARIQYLGRISYALYLMHGPYMHSVGYLVQGWAWRVTGHETHGAYCAGFVLAACVNTPAVVWAADLFMRAVDAPSVRFARWFEQGVLVDECKFSGAPARKELPR